MRRNRESSYCGRRRGLIPPPIMHRDLALPQASSEAAFAFFDQLDPVSPEALVGLWRGQSLPTGHRLDGVLDNLGWYGKRFNADLRADPLLFASGHRRLAPLDPGALPMRLVLQLAAHFGRTRMARNGFTHLQRALRARGPVASLKSLHYRGKTSAAMVYDRQPIVDHLRGIDDDRLMGVMEIQGNGGGYFFLLTRASAWLGPQDS
jgi:hypothetical protein